MSRNSSGTYSLPTSGNPVVTGTSVSSTWGNATLSDIATEITNSLDRTGRGAMTGGLQLVAGTLGAPGLTFASDTDSGIYRAGAHDFWFVVDGVGRLEWTNAGLAAIGTLSVSGAVTCSSTLAVTGAATLSSTLAVTGAATLSSTLAVTGTSTLTGLLTANGGATITGTVSLPSATSINSIPFSPSPTTLTAGTGWTFSTARYWKSPDGRVTVEAVGTVTSASPASSPFTATLAAGFRPVATLALTAWRVASGAAIGAGGAVAIPLTLTSAGVFAMAADVLNGDTVVINATYFANA